MIEPADGVAFTLAEDGDIRGDLVARARVSASLGVSHKWGTVDQVHGCVVVEIEKPGRAGEADALFTRQPGLPVAVFVADCLGVVVKGREGVGVAHAGWRGLSQRVLARLVEGMSKAGLEPESAYAGPAIGTCCFEVGEEVAASFEDDLATTTWNAASVDLLGAARRQLDGLPMWFAGRCTMHQPENHSHRGSGTTSRMAAIAWVPGVEAQGAMT